MKAQAVSVKTGNIYIGIDFGMALTKAAIKIAIPNSTEKNHFVIEFPRDAKENDSAVHIPSSIWYSEDRIFGLQPPKNIGGPTTLFGKGMELFWGVSKPETSIKAIDRLKLLLIEDWKLDKDNAPHKKILDNFTARDLVTLKIAMVLAFAKHSTDKFIQVKARGAQWNWHIQCAVPTLEGTTPQKACANIRLVLERAWELSKEIPNPEDGITFESAKKFIAKSKNQPLQDEGKSVVHSYPESLAAALFRLQSDDVTPGLWMTIDIGGLTTDTAFFWFTPGIHSSEKIASYYTIQSIECGFDQLVQAKMGPAKSTGGIGHKEIAEIKDAGLSQADYFKSFEETVNMAIGSTLAKTLKKMRALTGLFETTDGQVQKPTFKVLLLGGGSTHPLLQAKLKEWRWTRVNKGPWDHSPPHDLVDTETSTLPGHALVLRKDGTTHMLGNRNVFAREQAIVSLAYGLAQPPWDMPSHDIEPDGKPYVFKEPAENPNKHT